MAIEHAVPISTEEYKILNQCLDEAIAEAAKDELFHSFEQRGTDRAGLGLGLSIVKRAVERNHGTVHILNFPGRGCALVVELPRWQESSGKASEPADGDS